MAAFASLRDGSGIYRSQDPIQNLKIKVRLEKISQGVNTQAFLESQVQDEIELKELVQQQSQQVEKEVEDYVFSWQEKVFSEAEINYYKELDNCKSPIELKYHEEVKKILQKGRPTKRLYSHVITDHYSNFNEQFKKVTTSPNEQPTHLVEGMKNLRHRNLVKSGTTAVSKMNIVDYFPDKDVSKQRHAVNIPFQTMIILADLKDDFQDNEILNPAEFILCSIRVDANGTVIIMPDFNLNSNPYRIDADKPCKVRFQYTLIDSSNKMNTEQFYKEKKLQEQLYLQHIQSIQSSVGNEFEMPPPGIQKVYLFGEIVSAKNFEAEHLHVRYYLDLSAGWIPVEGSFAYGVTQSCQTKVEGSDDVAYFSHPFSVELLFDANHKEIDSVSSPLLLLEVWSSGSWQHCLIEGYGYICLPPSPGVYNYSVETWKPVSSSIRSQLQRFFIGSDESYDDIRLLATSQKSEKNQILSKIGLITESTGIITVRLNIIHQSLDCLRNTIQKDSLGNLLSKLGSLTIQASVFNVLEAFHNARQRMLAARESLIPNLSFEAKGKDDLTESRSDELTSLHRHFPT